MRDKKKVGITGFPTTINLSCLFVPMSASVPHVSEPCERMALVPSPHTFRAGADPGSELSHLGLASPRARDLGRFGPGRRLCLGPVTGITGGGSGYAAILAHAGGVLYGTELGSVTLKRIGFFCFPIKHSTHTVYWLYLCPKHERQQRPRN